MFHVEYGGYMSDSSMSATLLLMVDVDALSKLWVRYVYTLFSAIRD